MTLFTELVDDAKFIFRFRRQHARVMKRLDHAAPKAGDPAPDFTLTDVSGTEHVGLSDFRGRKPVAIVFGSYT